MSNEYNKLAKFYNKYWTQEAPDLFEKVLNRLILSSLPEKADILDLCCGTGQMCARLSQRLFNMTGLDNSAEMLKHAQISAPKAKFILADARNFTTDTKFDAVLSLFDSINHIMNPADLLKTFRGVKNVLKPEAAFLFDINNIKAFDASWENGFAMVEDDNICIMKPFYEPKSRRLVYQITTFELRDNSWRREDITVHERYYDNNEIMEALTEAGFTNIQFVDGDKDLRVKAFRGRTFVLAS
jgi:SAM-dependent methyltransferase